MVVEHADQARLKLNLTETSALNFLHTYPEKINSDRPEQSPGAPRCQCQCWVLPGCWKTLRGQNTDWCGTTTPFSALPCLKMPKSLVQRPKQLCRTELLNSGLMPVMLDPAKSRNNTQLCPCFGLPALHCRAQP